MSEQAQEIRIAHGTAVSLELDRGETITITTPDGSQGGDFSFPGFDQAITRNKLGWKRFGRPWLVFAAEPGDSLFDGDGAPVLEMVAYEADGAADIMYPGCWDEVYADRRPGCRDLISSALGIDRSGITGMLSFFISSTADDKVYRGLGPVDLASGDHLKFRALRDVEVAVSACPDTGIPGWQAGDLVATVAGRAAAS
jgi:uncharacterized protein YcgI (DUF1989 family)